MRSLSFGRQDWQGQDEEEPLVTPVQHLALELQQAI